LQICNKKPRPSEKRSRLRNFSTRFSWILNCFYLTSATFCKI